MLDIQREKIEKRNRLKEDGLSDQEIKQQMSEELKPFQPAFVNGKRVIKDRSESEQVLTKTKVSRKSSSIVLP